MGTAIALGTFDGVHLGHQKVLSEALAYNSIVVTFNLPPKAIISKTTELLMTTSDKISSLKSFGIKEVDTLDFENIRTLDAKGFLDFLLEKYSPCAIVCGYNYRFGKGATGDTEFLRQYCLEHSIDFRCCECVENEGVAVSSSYIRELLKKGEIEKANNLLFAPFRFKARVIHGVKRGRSIGFPTINQEYPDELVKLKCGVYASKIITNNNEYYGVSNIGFRPTWKTEKIISETYIENFSDDLYGKEVTVLPLHFIREEKIFSGIDELKNAISNDIKALKNYI